MAENLTRKILQKHLVEGELIAGSEIGIRIDHTLLQDATGTLAMLEFEALGLDRVLAEVSVQYVDHNILQTDTKNADDHKYLQTACARYGINYSPPGNGVSHQVHLERFGVPGKTLLGSDSHTPGAAGLSMLGIGAGGLDVSMAMAGRPYHLPCPKVLGVKLIGHLSDWVSAKDVILEMLRRYGVKGCVGMVVEYYGPGVKTLTATDREIIGNMGTELGATSSIFPSDENTRTYLEAQGRGGDWAELSADPGCDYDEIDEIDLAAVQPLIAKPSSPGNVVFVKDIAGLKVDQVIIGSSANSAYRDLMAVARIIRGRHSHKNTALHINPGSRQVLENAVQDGGAMALLLAGARIHESGCLGCIGIGQSPGTGQVSLRTFPRNFPGRSGAKNDQIYLCSPETAIAAAIKGEVVDPRSLTAEIDYPHIKDPAKYIVNKDAIITPSPELNRADVIRGPNIKPLPLMEEMPASLIAEVALVVGDNISTDGIMPAGSKVLPLRSNIEAISEFVFYQIEPDFPKICKNMAAAMVIGGENYGQGSSREHAALAPRYLGVRVKIVKSFARIHKANLCNFGILPLVFKEPADHMLFKAGSKVQLLELRSHLENGDIEIPVQVDGRTIITVLDVTARQRRSLLAGSALNVARQEMEG